MKKKTIIMIIIAVLVLGGIAIGIKIGLDYKKEDKIRSEVREISRVFDTSTDRSSLDEVLDRRLVNGGQYEKVEDVIKLYYKDLYNSLSNLEFLLDEDNFTSYLLGKNIKDDGPKFLKSRDNLSNSKAQIEEQYVLFNTLLNDDYTKSMYLESKDVDIYYRTFYLELTTLVLTEDVKENLKKEYDKVMSNIETYNEIFDFLAAHEAAWTLNNDVVSIEDSVLREEFNNLTKKLKNEEVIENNELAS